MSRSKKSQAKKAATAKAKPKEAAGQATNQATQLESKTDAGDEIVVEMSSGASRMVPRVVSLIMLMAVVLLVTAMFFRVMLQFVAPLFLAAVLVVIFEPVHKRVMQRLPGKPKWSALVTTLLVVFALLIPITWLGLNAIGELSTIAARFSDENSQTEILAITERVKEKSKPIISWYEETFQQDFENQMRTAGGQMAGKLGSLGIDGFLAVIGLIVGLGIMTLALYYFFADGPAMIEALMHLSPLDDDYERELLEKFAEVSRAVVIATLLSAAAQGLLAGIGYYFALDGGPIFLLTASTMLMAIVPFVGATIIWAPIVAWVAFYQGDTMAAIVLGAWCLVVVSNVDNLIKPLVLHGQSNLHPLLALLSVLGGVSVLGPVGILVGPMLVAFLQALLNMLRKELDDLQGEEKSVANGDADAAPQPAS